MLRIILPCLLTLCLVGCGDSKGGYSGPTGTVSGKVTVGGKPVPEGSKIIFQTKEGSNYSCAAAIAADGTYKLLYNGDSSIPAVNYVATIVPPPGSAVQASPDLMKNPGMVVSGAPAAAGAFPDRYSMAATSTLEYTVKAGAQTKDFDLEVR